MASLFSQKDTQDMTTSRMQGPYTCHHILILEVSTTEFRNIFTIYGEDTLLAFFTDLDYKVAHVTLQMEADNKCGKRAWKYFLTDYCRM